MANDLLHLMLFDVYFLLKIFFQLNIKLIWLHGEQTKEYDDDDDGDIDVSMCELDIITDFDVVDFCWFNKEIDKKSKGVMHLVICYLNFMICIFHLIHMNHCNNWDFY